MNYFGLIFYQSLILFVSYRFGFGQELEYDLNLQEVAIDGIVGLEEEIWESVLLSKIKYSGEFIFQNNALNGICDGKFSHLDIEIVEVFGRVLRFSLVRWTNRFMVNLLFVEQSSVSRFFADIRWQQRKGCGRIEFKVDKLFQYQIYYPQNDDERLQLLADSPAVYLKSSCSVSVNGLKSLNFASHRIITPSERVYLVLQSMTFNFSAEVEAGSNMYILCSMNIPTYRFILLFPDERHAVNLLSTLSIGNYLNREIPCPTDWEFEYNLDVQQVSFDGLSGMEERVWEPVVLSKYRYSDNFIFQNDELKLICSGKFSWLDIEVVELFGRVLRFILIRGTNHFSVNVLFVEQSSALLFLAIVRWPQRWETSRVSRVRKFFQYQIFDPENNEIERLQLLGESVAVYSKNSHTYSDSRPKTVNFARNKNFSPTEDVYLILQSMTFNMSPDLGSNVYLLCPLNIPTHLFILVFSDERPVRHFFSTAVFENDLNRLIPCPTDWLTPQIFQQVHYSSKKK